MIDDGKYDPPDVKIENQERFWNDQLQWEREFKRMNGRTVVIVKRKRVKPRFRDRLLALIVAVGEAGVMFDKNGKLKGGIE